MKKFSLMILAFALIVLLSPIIFIGQIIRKLILNQSLTDYFYTIAIGLDQLGGSLLYSQEDWTVSSYTFYLSKNKNKAAYYFMRFIDFLFGKEHCKNSFENEYKTNGVLK